MYSIEKFLNDNNLDYQKEYVTRDYLLPIKRVKYSVIIDYSVYNERLKVNYGSAAAQKLKEFCNTHNYTIINTWNDSNIFTPVVIYDVMKTIDIDDIERLDTYTRYCQDYITNLKRVHLHYYLKHKNHCEKHFQTIKRYYRHLLLLETENNL